MGDFKIIDRALKDWDGSPTTLNQGEGVSLSQTPVGDLIVTFFNKSEENDAGQIALTTGGSNPQFIPVDPLMNAPQIMIQNFEGNNLNLTNTSITGVPIEVQAWGPGYGKPEKLPDDGVFYSLNPYNSRTTKSNPNFMQLVMRALGQYTVFGVFIGSKPSIYCVNAPDPDTVPVKGYTTITKNNNWPVSNNWLGKTIWVVNLSALTSTQGEVSLKNL
jgi:hypothetical protein